MLKALNEIGDPVIGPEATAGARYFCPACRSPLAFKKGRVVVPHFAHLPGADCVLSEGESARHLGLKWLCLKLFAAFNPEPEHVLGGVRRADVLVGGRFVVECQVSALGIEEWEQRTGDYNFFGLPVLWVWDIRRVCGLSTVSDAKARAAGGSWEQRVSATVRHCHQHSYGHLYCADARELAACHLGTASERHSPGADNGDWPDRWYTPRALKQPRFNEVSACEPRAFVGPSGLRLINLSEGVWWKQQRPPG